MILTRTHYTAHEAAYILQVSHMTIYRMIEDGRLSPVRINPTRIPISTLDTYLAKNTLTN